MTPTYDELFPEKYDLDQFLHLQEDKRTEADGSQRGSMRRSKRIRNARRPNSIDGMQRRRNKRIGW